MMVYTFLGGEQPTPDNMNDIFDQTLVIKAAPQGVTSSTALTDDDDLWVELGVGTWLVWLWCHVTGDEAGDVDLRWNFSGTGTILRSSIGPAEAMTDRESCTMVMRGNLFDTEQRYGIDTTGSTLIKEELCVVVTDGGWLNVSWAQGTSNGTATEFTTATRMWVVNVA